MQGPENAVLIQGWIQQMRIRADILCFRGPIIGVDAYRRPSAQIDLGNMEKKIGLSHGARAYALQHIETGTKTPRPTTSEHENELCSDLGRPMIPLVLAHSHHPQEEEHGRIA